MLFTYSIENATEFHSGFNEPCSRLVLHEYSVYTRLYCTHAIYPSC